MFISCPKCGRDVYLDTNFLCPTCNAVVRRCADCRHYDSALSFCRVLEGTVNALQAQEPTRLSVSSGCKAYEPKPIPVAV